MDKLRRRILCLLTGGHRYADSNLESYHFPNDRVTCFRNVCVKCGKALVYTISDEILLNDVDGRG